MIVAELNTEHYQFMAIGKTEAEAKERVAEVFLLHLVQASPVDTDRENEQDRFMAYSGFDLAPGPADTWVDAVNDYYGIDIWDFRKHTMLRDASPVGKE